MSIKIKYQHQQILYLLKIILVLIFSIYIVLNWMVLYLSFSSWLLGLSEPSHSTSNSLSIAFSFQFDTPNNSTFFFFIKSFHLVFVFVSDIFLPRFITAFIISFCLFHVFLTNIVFTFLLHLLYLNYILHCCNIFFSNSTNLFSSNFLSNQVFTPYKITK